MLYTQNVLIIFPWKYCEAVSIFSWKLCHLHPENIFLFQYFSLLEIAQPCTQFSFLTSGKALLTPPSYLHEPRVSEPRSFFFFFFFVSRIYFYSLSSHYHLSSVLQQKLLNCLFHLAFINPLLSELVSFTFHIVWCYHIAFLRKKNLYIVYRVFHDLPSSTASTFTGISLNFLEFIRSLPTRGNGLKYAVSLAWNQAILLRLAEDYSWFKYYLNMTA